MYSKAYAALRQKALRAVRKLARTYGDEDPRVAAKQREFPTVFPDIPLPDHAAADLQTCAVQPSLETAVAVSSAAGNTGTRNATNVGLPTSRRVPELTIVPTLVNIPNSHDLSNCATSPVQACLTTSVAGDAATGTLVNIGPVANALPTLLSEIMAAQPNNTGVVSGSYSHDPLTMSPHIPQSSHPRAMDLHAGSALESLQNTHRTAQPTSSSEIMAEDTINQQLLTERYSRDPFSTGPSIPQSSHPPVMDLLAGSLQHTQTRTTQLTSTSEIVADQPINNQLTTARYSTYPFSLVPSIPQFSHPPAMDQDAVSRRVDSTLQHTQNTTPQPTISSILSTEEQIDTTLFLTPSNCDPLTYTPSSTSSLHPSYA
jgi:hypothetical protein